MKLTVDARTASHPRLPLLVYSFCCADSIYFSQFRLPLLEPAYFYNVSQVSHTRNQLTFLYSYCWCFWYNSKIHKKISMNEQNIRLILRPMSLLLIRNGYIATINNDNHFHLIVQAFSSLFVLLSFLKKDLQQVIALNKVFSKCSQKTINS